MIDIQVMQQPLKVDSPDIYRQQLRRPARQTTRNPNVLPVYQKHLTFKDCRRIEEEGTKASIKKSHCEVQVLYTENVNLTQCLHKATAARKRIANAYFCKSNLRNWNQIESILQTP